MGTDDLLNSELLILTIVQETSLSIQTAGVMFDLFEKEHGSSDRMTQAEIKRWIKRQNVLVNQ